MKYKKKGSYNVLTEISKHVTLFQLMDSLENTNHAISVIGYWIFDSNNKITLLLNRESLDMIFSPSVGEEQVANFELVFNAVRSILLDVRLKKE